MEDLLKLKERVEFVRDCLLGHNLDFLHYTNE